MATEFAPTKKPAQRIALGMRFAFAPFAFAALSSCDLTADGNEATAMATSRVTAVALREGSHPTRTTPSHQANAAPANRPTQATQAPAGQAQSAQRPDVDPHAYANPLEAAFPLHGVCYHFLGQVRAEANSQSRVIGYMRRGSHFRAGAKVGTRGCARGWYEVPGEGYVCSGDGFLIGTEPQNFQPSPQAASLEDALPYPYAKLVREDAAQYYRVPTSEEESVANAFLADLRARKPRTAANDEPDPLPEAAPQNSDRNGSPAANALPSFMRMRMQRGFYVSVDGMEERERVPFLRTVRGAYVRAESMIEASPGSMRGVVLGGDWTLPLGFVHRRGATQFRVSANGSTAPGGDAEYHSPFRVSETQVMRDNQALVATENHRAFRRTAVRVVSLRARPSIVPSTAKWIHVNRAEQTLTAYEGDRPVFATLISSGRDGFATPAGTFRIQSKHVSATMDDPDSETGAYSIEDVPWTMYFSGSIALHGAFWHDAFGTVRSHGCVNLSPADARWIFQWTEPVLPTGWHGVFANEGTGRRGEMSTFVVVD